MSNQNEQNESSAQRKDKRLKRLASYKANLNNINSDSLITRAISNSSDRIVHRQPNADDIAFGKDIDSLSV